MTIFLKGQKKSYPKIRFLWNIFTPFRTIFKALLYLSIVHADPESQHGQQVAKKRQEKDNYSCFYIPSSGLEIWTDLHLNVVTPSERATVISPFLVAKKKRQEKDNNSWTGPDITVSRFYVHWSSLEIQSSTALKFLTIIDSKAKDSWTWPDTTALSRSLKVKPKICERDLRWQQVYLVQGKGQRVMNGTWDYSFKSIVERKAKDLRTFLPTRKLSISCTFIHDQQTNSENKKTHSQKRLLGIFDFRPILESVDRHVDFLDIIYSNTFFHHFAWEWNVCNLLQFPCEAILPLKWKKKKKMQLWRGWLPRWLSGQFKFKYIRSSFPLRAKRTQSSLISSSRVPSSQKKIKTEALTELIATSTFRTTYILIQSLKNAALKGLIATLTFWMTLIHSLFISPESETYAPCQPRGDPIDFLH